MSSGKIEGNFFKNIQSSLLLDKSAILTDFIIQKSIKSKSKPIINDLEKSFCHKLEQTNERSIENHFKIIKDIHLILKNSNDLTQKQKFDYCRNQRSFMRLYLQTILKKLKM